MGLFNKKLKEENQRLLYFNAQLVQENTLLKKKIDAMGVNEYHEAKAKIDMLNKKIISNNDMIARLHNEIQKSQNQFNKLNKSIVTQEKKLQRSKELYNSVEYALENFFVSDVTYGNCRISRQDFEEIELISPSVILKLHSMDVKSLRKAYRENEKLIDRLLEQYSSRYTTKANKSIYNLMVIALRAELQNILHNLKYEKLDESIEHVKNISAKYLEIVAYGNQSIAGTLTKFIGEIEYLFINAVKIEYNYYVKKEQAKQEQLEIRAKMRQEAEERKALEAERKKIEIEESKFKNKISDLQEQAQNSDGDELAALQARILELQAQLANVTIKKDEISKLQNGKAGNVYIISNLGSFGDNVFKIGMTRRIDPQDRVNELGDASVPFKFDVHSFIFSDNASDLETELHKRLENKRVNKVNRRKEFFNTTIEELEALVYEICPTAEFNKTMLANEFRQSQSTDEIYTSNIISDDLHDDEDE